MKQLPAPRCEGRWRGALPEEANGSEASQVHTRGLGHTTELSVLQGSGG